MEDVGLLFRKRTGVSRAFVTGLARHRHFLSRGESPAALRKFRIKKSSFPRLGFGFCAFC
jgi:hypothetical protein